MASFGPRGRSYGPPRGRGRGRGYFGGRSDRGGRGGRSYGPPSGPQKGLGGEAFQFDICRYYTCGNCVRGDTCHHLHVVQRVSELEVSERKPDGSRGDIRDIALFPGNPGHMFTACDDGQVKMWKTPDGVQWKEESAVPFSEWRPIGSLLEVDGMLFVGYGHPYSMGSHCTVYNIRVVNLTSGDMTEVADPATQYAHKNRINCVCLGRLANGDTRLVTGCEDGTICLWSQQTVPGQSSAFKKEVTLEGHIRGVTGLLFTEASGVLWSCSNDTTIRIWDLNTNSCVHTVTEANEGHKGAVTCMTLASSDGAQYVVSGGLDGLLAVWNANDGSKVFTQTTGAGVSALGVFEPTATLGTVLLVGYEDGTISVRSFPEFGLAFELHPRICNVGHSGPVRKLLPLLATPGSNERYFLSGGQGGTAMCWKLELPAPALNGP